MAIQWNNPIVIAIAVTAAAALLIWLWWWVPKWQMRSVTAGDPKARADIEDNFRKTVGQALGGIAVLIGAGMVYYGTQQTLLVSRRSLEASDKQSQRNLEASRALLISQQVSKGFQDLGNKDAIMVRLGGIYGLEGVMSTSEQYHQPVLEALCAFVRDGTIGVIVNDRGPATDIQAALAVIGRRIQAALALGVIERRAESPGHVNLSGANIRGVALLRANLSGADLHGANLSTADLGEANLSPANLSGANLSDANLFAANLSGADLHGASLSAGDLREANLRHTDLHGANLRGANLSNVLLFEANLEGADLSSANLSGANLEGADLSNANLSDANLRYALHLTQAQLEKACGKPAELSEGLSLDRPCPDSPVAAPLNRKCRRKIEMTPAAQSRNDTPPAADTPSAIRHHCHTLGLGGGVKDQSRRLPVRTAQPLRPSPGPSTIEQPCEPAEPLRVVSRDRNRWAGRSQRASRGQDQR